MMVSDYKSAVVALFSPAIVYMTNLPDSFGLAPEAHFGGPGLVATGDGCNRYIYVVAA